MAASAVTFTIVRNVAFKLVGLNKGLNFIETTMKDVNEGKDPPARGATWQVVIDDAEEMERNLRTLKWLGAQRGDVSPEAQNDCARHEAVLVAFREYYETLIASEPDIPTLISELKDIKNTLSDRSNAAAKLQKTYANLANSPNEFVRSFFAWATYDLIKVEKALNGAAGEANNRLVRVESFSSRVAGAKADLTAYEARIPKMRDYCARRHASLPLSINVAFG